MNAAPQNSIHDDILSQVQGLLLTTEDQALIASSARDVVQNEAPLSRVRQLRQAGAHWDEALWARLVALGWPGMTFPVEQGGLGLGLAEAALLCEALGANLVPTPLISTLLAGSLDPHAEAASGVVVALAWQETPRHGDPRLIQARCIDGHITGEKVHVLDARAAARFVVTAWEDDVLRLWAVEAQHVRLTPLTRLDGRDAAHVHLERAPACRLDATVVDLERSLDAATAALSAEMLGGMQAAFDLTLRYLKERVQFDQPIGRFQALQHRAADCFIALEVCRSAVEAAVRAPTPSLVSLAKTLANDAYLKICKEAVQMHGGIGMTDEHDIGLYLKRAWACTQTLGDSDFHRDRWARLHGY